MKKLLKTPGTDSRARSRAGLWPDAVKILAVAALLAGVQHVRAARSGAALVRATQAQIMADSHLQALGEREGAGVYQAQCALCHGAQMQGDAAKGAPRLDDEIWLHGSGSIYDIESTILYGIRSGHPRALNLEMPAFGRDGLLSAQQVADVVEYVLELSKQPHDAVAAERGQALFEGAGQCFDCHSTDGYGVADYGTPPLTGRGGAWLYGGDRQTLYKSVYDGRHGVCPAWIGKLSFVQIRALAVYIHGGHRLHKDKGS